MTSYSLRTASPAKTRVDAVVVGVVGGPKGPRLCDAADDISSAFGRRLRPFLSTMGVTGKAGEAVRRMHIKARQLSRSSGITQALQSRAKQDGSAIALVDIDVIGLDLMAVGRDAVAQGSELAGDGVIARLALG